MIPDATFDPLPPGRKTFRLRFSLLALLLFTTAVCLLLAWWVQPNRVVATALFRISRTTPTIVGNAASAASDKDFDLLKKTQVATLRSHFVLLSAARKPGVGSLSILKQKDPVEWLSEHLIVEFPQDAELLSISLEGNEEHATELATLVDAVVAAYQDEVLFKESQRRQRERDMLNRELSQLNSEVEHKMTELVDLIDEADLKNIATSGAMQEVYKNRLGRVDSELLRLEEEQLRNEIGGDSSNATFHQRRIAQLRKRQTELEKMIAKGTRSSAEITTRQNELEQLRSIAEELSKKLKLLEIDAAAPGRIELVQKAIVSPLD